jgi:hypothetical protein
MGGRLVKKLTKGFLSLLFFSFFFTTYQNSSSANEIQPMYWPLEVNLTTSQNSYNSNEVVSWKVSISGGTTTGPNFDIHFTDSKGHSYWIYDLKQYTTSFNLSYKEPGKVTAYVTVYGPGNPAKDSRTITIKQDY